MPKVTQKFKLWTLLSSGNVVSPADISKTLGIKEKAVPVYVHKLKKKFKATIEVSREGKTVVGYKLVNKIKVPEYRRNNAQIDKVANDAAKAKMAPVKKVTTASALDTDSPVSLGDKELADVARSIGAELPISNTPDV